MYLIIEDGTPREITLRQLAQEIKSQGVSPPAWWQIADDTRRNEALARYNVFPFTQLDKPTYDPDTQRIELGQFTIQNGQYSRGWEVINLSQAEIDAIAAQKKQRTSTQLDNPVQKVLLKIAFNQENRLRTLESRPNITIQQFRQFVEDQI